MRIKLKELYPILIPLLIYIVSILIIKPWGNYAVNDDFYYFVQVRAFSQGLFTKSGIIGPSIILQIFLGLIWSNFFGLTFISLRVLTILLAIVSLVGVYKILKILKVDKKLILLSLLTITFNPFFYSLSLTFMTEIYAFVSIIWSIYFLLVFIDYRKTHHLFIASLFLGFSSMVRQHSVALLPAFILVLFLSDKSNKSKKVKDTLVVSLPFLFLFMIGLFWPKYKSDFEPQLLSISFLVGILNNVITSLRSTAITPYIGFLLSPISIMLLLSKNNKAKALILALALLLANVYYKWDIFRISNVFYLEGLYAKSTITLRSSLFNNVPFKLFVSYLSATSFLTLFYLLIEIMATYLKDLHRKLALNIDLKPLVLVFSTILFYVSSYISNHLYERYDRYFFNFLILLTISLTYLTNLKNLKPKFLTWVIFTVLFTVTFLLTFDYSREKQLKWDLALKLNDRGINSTDIYLYNDYTKFQNILSTKDFYGKEPAMPEDFSPSCYIQNYSVQTKNILNDLLLKIDKRPFVIKYLSNPIIKDFGYAKANSGNLRSADIIYFEEEYRTPMYNLLGKRMFIRAFCKGI